MQQVLLQTSNKFKDQGSVFNLVFVMTISAMRKKYVVLGLAMCLFLSSFDEVSCQADGSSILDMFGNQKLQSNANDFQDVESQYMKKQSESDSSRASSKVMTEQETSSTSRRDESEYETVSGHEEGTSSSMANEIQREIEAHLGDMNMQSGSDDGVDKVGESKAAFGIDAERQKRLQEIERQLEAAAATKVVEELEFTAKKSKVETRETKIEENEGADDESGKHQIYYGKAGGKESAENAQFTSETQKIESKAASSESRQESNTYNNNGWTKSNGGSGMLGSLGIAQSGAWRCFNQDKNGAKEDGDASIVIPKYEIDEIIKEESFQGTASKTSSLIASLTQIVEKHKNGKWNVRVDVEDKKKSRETVRLETLEKLKVTLKQYRSLSARELVAHADFEEILAIAARYEEVSLAKVSHISRLSMYKSVIIEGRKASERVQLAQKRIRLHEEIVTEKQNNVDAEFALVKALAQRGDMLYVKIFAIKKLVLKLEAEKQEVDMNFQKTVGNLSRVIEEASHAEEQYHLVVRKWKEEKASAEFSQEAIQSAEVVWVQFLNTLQTLTV